MTTRNDFETTRFTSRPDDSSANRINRCKYLISHSSRDVCRCVLVYVELVTVGKAEENLLVTYGSREEQLLRPSHRREDRSAREGCSRVYGRCPGKRTGLDTRMYSRDLRMGNVGQSLFTCLSLLDNALNEPRLRRKEKRLTFTRSLARLCLENRLTALRSRETEVAT